jgi:hypothetical protein
MDPVSSSCGGDSETSTIAANNAKVFEQVFRAAEKVRLEILRMAALKAAMLNKDH